MDFQQIIQLVCVCGVVCLGGIIVIAVVVLRLGVNVVMDILGGGNVDKMKPVPPMSYVPPNPAGGYAAQNVVPQVSSFEEALARRQQMKQGGSPYAAQTSAPRPFGAPPTMPTNPNIGSPRPSLTPGVPYVPPPAFPRTQASSQIPDLGAQRLASRRSRRSQSDDYNDTYIEDSGDGLDLLL